MMASRQVFALSDMDSNKLLSKPEFCLFMYLMHALRNFGGNFRLPNQITPNQAARILGLEQLIRPNTGAPPAGQPFCHCSYVGPNQFFGHG